MSKMGRAVSKLAVVDRQELKRPNPITGMDAASRSIWKRIVNQYPAEHFKPHHLDLLRMYCESAAVNKMAMKRYIQSDYVEVMYLRVADKMAGRCQGLAVKLGINVNNRMAHRGQGGEPAEPKSKRDGLLFGGNKK